MGHGNAIKRLRNSIFKFAARYEESNNKSAIQDPEFVVKAINNLKRQGVIAFTDS